MALKSSREGLRKELVDYLGNIIIDDNLRNEIIKVVGDNFVTSESLNETVNNLTIQITTESGERIEVDDTLQTNITAEATAREQADTTLQNNINTETTARQEAITNLERMIDSSGLQMDLLWTNASPSSEFLPQTINLDLSGYKSAMFLGRSGTGISELEFIGSFPISNEVTFRLTALHSFIAIRNVRFNNGIEFENGLLVSSYNRYGNDFENNNIYCIPTHIYGIK